MKKILLKTSPQPKVRNIRVCVETRRVGMNDVGSSFISKCLLHRLVSNWTWRVLLRIMKLQLLFHNLRLQGELLTFCFNTEVAWWVLAEVNIV